MLIVDRLGEALKLLRTRRGWPQKQLAARAKITKGMVSSYETGRQTPDLATVEKILTALEADLCDLYCAFEFVSGRPSLGHDLSPRFLPGQSKLPKAASPHRVEADPTAVRHEAGDDSQGAPPLPAHLERALSDIMEGGHQLLRHLLGEHGKRR